MKRGLLIILILSLAACASAPVHKQVALIANVLSVTKVILDLGAGRREYIEVEVLGFGSDRIKAREDGFRTAVLQAVGSVVVTQTESQNRRLVRDEIVSYSSGYVDRHEILSEKSVGSGVELRMKVWVAESRIARRLLADASTAGQIDGKNLGLRIEGVLQERYQGDKLLSTVLSDFPRRAFDIKLDKHKVNLNERREVSLVIPFELKWNYDYLASLYEALYETRSEPSFCWSCILLGPQAEDPSARQRRETQTSFTLMVKPPQNLLMGWRGTLVFDDNFKIRAMYQAFVASRPAIRLVIQDGSGRVAHDQCFYYPHLDHVVHYHYPNFYMFTIDHHHTRASINGNQVLRGELPINLRGDTKRLDSYESVKISVVSRQNCSPRP